MSPYSKALCGEGKTKAIIPEGWISIPFNAGIGGACSFRSALGQVKEP